MILSLPALVTIHFHCIFLFYTMKVNFILRLPLRVAVHVLLQEPHVLLCSHMVCLHRETNHLFTNFIWNSNTFFIQQLFFYFIFF